MCVCVCVCVCVCACVCACVGGWVGGGVGVWGGVRDVCRHCLMLLLLLFIVALFSALEQTHCAYMSEQLFYISFLNIHRSDVLTALAWLVPHEFRVHHTTMLHVTSLCKATYIIISLYTNVLNVTDNIYFSTQNKSVLTFAEEPSTEFHG